MQDAGAVYFGLGTDPAKSRAAIDGILEETERLVQDGVTDDEMKKARAMHKGGYVLRMEDSMRVALSAATDMLHRGRVQTREEYFELVDSTTAADVQAAAQRYLKSDDLHIAAVGPETMTLPSK